MLFIFVATRRQGKVPARNQFLVIALAGILDTGGNRFSP
jgi:hypothetical protein